MNNIYNYETLTHHHRPHRRHDGLPRLLSRLHDTRHNERYLADAQIARLPHMRHFILSWLEGQYADRLPAVWRAYVRNLQILAPKTLKIKKNPANRLVGLRDFCNFAPKKADRYA